MTPLHLKKHHDRRIQSGHPWVFSNELTDIPALTSGSLVEVFSHTGKSYGSGLYNPNSLIAVRLLGDKISDLSTGFFIKRIAQAEHLRRQIMLGEHSYRLVFGESDFLPGVIIDRFGDYFSLQILSSGMDLHLQAIIEALVHLFPSTLGIIEKNTSHLRQLEGLELREGVVYGSIPDGIEITENGVRLSLSLLGGQKTGYFLDQKHNRIRVKELISNLRVLDCFCNQGGFALNAGIGGAKEVLGIDSSESAIKSATQNAVLNNLTNVQFQKADVFEYLTVEVRNKSSWDCIILDPPSFTKSKKNVGAAKKGYAEINCLALQLLAKGGLLVSASCSQHIYEETLLEIIRNEAQKLNIPLRLLYRGGQSPDHPILVGMPETQYLKFFIFFVGK
ncbi:MAG: class I SAM-dependent rRNA methyltransferase [Bacteroidetes bacterium]|nr:class I SAM-dependent rRNA methyltransferase [Bacteroidota bacterium]